MFSSDAIFPQSPAGEANCVTKAAAGAEDNWRMHRCRSGAHFKNKREGSCFEPVVASVPSTRNDDAPKDHLSGVAAAGRPAPQRRRETRQDLPSRPPPATGRTDPGRARSTQDCRRQNSEIVILRRMGRGPKASKAPRGAGPKALKAPAGRSQCHEAGRQEIGGRPQVRSGGRAASKGGNGNATTKGAGRVGNGRGGGGQNNNKADSGGKLF